MNINISSFIVSNCVIFNNKEKPMIRLFYKPLTFEEFLNLASIDSEISRLKELSKTKNFIMRFISKDWLKEKYRNFLSRHKDIELKSNTIKIIEINNILIVLYSILCDKKDYINESTILDKIRELKEEKERLKKENKDIKERIVSKIIKITDGIKEVEEIIENRRIYIKSLIKEN